MEQDKHVIDEKIVLAMEGITKIYDNGFVANRNIDFYLRRGEIHGLIGENGAGKTTLMKVLFGHETPESGHILLNGGRVKIDNPLQAIDLGIGMVHQHFMLVNNLSVAENMVLGTEPTKSKIFFNKQKAVKMTQETCEKFNLPVDPDALIKDLSVGYRQRVEILKVLLRGVKILILDEPTAVLTPQETEELFEQLIALKEQGYSIVFISHKLQEVKRICDRITVLRMGEVSGTANIADVSIQDISRMMVGRDVDLDIEKKKAEPKQTVLRVRDLVYANKFGINVINGMSFDVRAGEILGVAGVEGNGQSELSETICGLLPVQKGTVQISGADISKLSINSIRKKKVSMVHEDRMIFGVSSTQPIFENLISERYDIGEYSYGIFQNFKYIDSKSKELIRDFKVKCDGPQAAVKTLSGGNVQKVVAAREFTSSPKLLVASHPTRGIDVGATDLVRRKIVELRDNEDTAVLLFSADLNELINVSDSIIVVYEGRVVAYFENLEGITPQILGEYMLGIKHQDEVEIGGVLHED